MRTAVDTNILSALWSNEPDASRIANDLAQARSINNLIMYTPVYAELMAHPSVTQKFVDEFLKETSIAMDFALDEAVWRQTATCFTSYAHRRRRSGNVSPKRLLVDFIVASHAFLRADRLMTLDVTRYRQDFPKLRMV